MNSLPVNTANAKPAKPAAASSRALRKYLIGGVALVLVLGGYWYFSRSADQAGGGGRGNAAPVRVAKVVRRDMAVVEHSLGTVVANTTVQVTSRVQGVVNSAGFKEGQFVKKGDLLFQIDPRGFEAALEQARAVLAKDQAQLVNANRDKARYQSLSDQGAISAQQRDTSATNADVLAATVAADKAAVDMAALNLDYTQIRSPVDGKTGPLLVQPGNMVSATNLAPLVTIQQVRPVKLSFTLPQSDLDRIQARQKNKGLTAILENRTSGGQPLSAPVDFTSNAVSGQSGTIELRADFANDDLALVPGQLVNVTVQLDDIPNALVVPRDAVNDGPDGSYVYEVADDKAVSHPVKILFDDTVNVAVQGDIKPGDTVIIEGQLRVDAGGPVRVIGGKAAGASADAPQPGDKGKTRIRIPAGKS
ncbi:MAG TPA: efflux RND transporter periplasmic adaptor subunit [Rhizomicrobium sp.]|nr:efflux RND transporter periplasmic adaptor subunit [Rhizomicrobium sp.]